MEMFGMTTKAKKLRDLLLSKDAAVLMEAHNGLTAKLVQEAGFQGIWGSGLAMSASLGVRDSNEASWTQVLEQLEFMTDAVDIPLLLDGDTGYGNFNNMRRLVKKLEQRGVAGVCIEDKLFPKTNSFIDGEKQALAEIDEFCGKIRAAKDTQLDPDFMVVARTEAFIAGWGLNEAILRATAYAESGADVILVHSKRKDPEDLVSFMREWKSSTPVIIVPTKYPTVPISKFMEMGITNFIFANQTIRTVITAVQQNLKKLRTSYDLMTVEKEIAPVAEIFRLQNVDELKESEGRYLPQTKEAARAVVLAATKGNFGALVENKPKCMLRLQGKPVLTWHTEAFNRQGIKNIAVVRGYKKQAVDLAGLHYFDNDDYASTGELYSLHQARDFLRDDVVIAYGDILYDPFILQSLLADDGGFKLRGRKDSARDLVATTGLASPVAGQHPMLEEVRANPEKATGEWIGLVALRGKGTERVTALLDKVAKEKPADLKKATLVDLLEWLMDDGVKVRVVHTYGHWRDLDEQADLLETDRVS
jgi:phosphoenolpyruvate phosphomutase